MTGRPKYGWGGAREGAGRPAKALTASQVERMLTTADKYALDRGKSVDELLLDILYHPETSTRDRLWAIKLFKDFTLARTTEDAPYLQHSGPTVYLPEHRPVDPPRCEK